MHRIILVLAVLAAPILTPLAPSRAEDRQPQVPQLDVETYTLPNGLEVILLEDHTTPVVGVNLWYKVGSKNEKSGRTGFAHLFEHLMFQGSEHHDKEYFGPIEKLGAQINGSTSTDRTNYFETLPSNALELALWLESDRMGFLLPALTQEKLDNQRDVVKNERRQRVDNVPYGQSEERLLEALYPPDHPYHHSVIGSMADLSAASREDVSDFFRTYYNPSNASLCLVGDFQPEEARRLIAKYFGAIPKGPEVEPIEPWVPTLDESKHIEMTDRVALPRVQLVWPTVPAGHPDEKALDVLAVVLGQLDKENRLYRALMYDKQLAASVSASHPTQDLSGTFEVQITAQPGQTLDDMVAIADAEIERLKEEGPTEDEVIKVQNGDESSLIIGLQSATRKADFLNQHNVIFGDPLAYKDQMKKLFQVTPADVKRVANKYLIGKRIRLDVVPGPPTERAPEVAVDREAQKEVNAPSPKIEETFDRSVMPEPGPNPDFSPPPVVRRKLSNGLELLIAERHELPILTLDLVVKGGEALVPPGKEGLASLTASLLTEGTESKDSLELAGALSRLGASIDADGGLESSGLSLTTLTRHLDEALDIYTDVLLHPAFPERELSRLQSERIALLLRLKDYPQAIAGIVFPKLLYGLEHPYGRPDLGTPESIKGLSREDIEAFYHRLFLPNNAAMIVVGDTTPDKIVAQLEEALDDWKPGKATELAIPKPKPSDRPVTVYLVDKPQAAQSVLAVGQVGVPRSTPDYFPLTVMNAILGGQFSSRINLNLREDKGYTYGARSSFAFRLGPGPFEAGGAVQTAVTKEALVELIKEIRDITGPRPATDAELAFAKDRIVKGFPSKFETTSGVAGTLGSLFIYSLPDDYYTHYQERVEKVTRSDVARVARTYLDPDHMTILIVGDRTQIEPSLRALPYAKVINVLDPDGNPLPGDAEPADDIKKPTDATDTP